MAESKSSSDSQATPSRLANLKNQLGAVDDLIMSTVLKSASVTPGTGELSLPRAYTAPLTTASLDRRQGAAVAAADVDQLQAVSRAVHESWEVSLTRCNASSFVAKSGPIFVAQDAAEAVLRWEDGSKTIFFGVVWAFLCESSLTRAPPS